uniref:Uncharacterized protein AlNc14C26G2579 n=1 Tax=Albugo laibachii Nc14 TaxID=890382 RepID=F0W6U3_9STRA|nr:conserved hypothetical protein [Albugo laibachii Nc14]|eukprot:CCA16838.1 conserved hypothetical protein [Albugo laibachii Nc14]
MAPASATGDERLPPGWTKRESKSQRGRFYYVSPGGKTQWVRPQAQPAPRQNYNWLNECEIDFTEPRLGVSLHEVKQVENIPYAQFQAEVDELPKVGGKPGAAEIYNWSVKPDKFVRLVIGMRVIEIDGLCLAGYTYNDIVEKMKKSTRPIKMKFADVSKGTVEDNPELARAAKQEKERHGKSSTAYLKQKQQYLRVLVMSELRGEMWRIETKKLVHTSKLHECKHEIIHTEFDQESNKLRSLTEEQKQLKLDEKKYKKMLEELSLQEKHLMESPELTKNSILLKKNTSLEDDIAKLTQANKKLRKERSALQTTMDGLDSQLSKYADTNTDDSPANDEKEEDVFGLDPNASASEKLSALRLKSKQFDDEVLKEQRKVSKVEKEMAQLNKHLTRLTEKVNGGVGTKSAKSKDSTSSSQSKDNGQDNGPPNASDNEIAQLEAHILDLRKVQRAAVGTLAKAAQNGDKELAKEYQEKRTSIKEELKQAQDLLHEKKANALKDASVNATSLVKKGKSSNTQSNKILSTSTYPKASTSSSRKPKSNAEDNRIRAMPTISGYLEKGPTEWSEKGLIRNMKTMRGARERWCEITVEGFLQYYKRRGDPVVRGQIHVGDPSFEVNCEDLKRGKEFAVCTSTQQSNFFARTNEEMVKWVTALRNGNSFLRQENKSKTMRSAVLAYHTTNVLKRSHNSNRNVREAVSSSRNTPLESSTAETADKFPEDHQDEFYGRATLGF